MILGPIIRTVQYTLCLYTDPNHSNIVPTDICNDSGKDQLRMFPLQTRTRNPDADEEASSLGLAAYIYSLDASTTDAYLTFAASAFGQHALISSIQVSKSITGE